MRFPGRERGRSRVASEKRWWCVPPGGEPFPASLAEVKSPVDPRDGLASRGGVLQLNAAWVPGEPYQLSIR